jgi:hypothetical protein
VDQKLERRITSLGSAAAEEEEAKEEAHVNFFVVLLAVNTQVGC